MSTRVRGGASRARGAGEASLERLTQSVEAAQTALKDLRNELGKGSRDVLGDLDMTLKDARKNLRSVSRTVSKDLEEIQKALTAGKPARAPTAGARKRTTAKPDRP
jgi:chromosome segregation ATPase